MSRPERVRGGWRAGFAFQVAQLSYLSLSPALGRPRPLSHSVCLPTGWQGCGEEAEGTICSRSPPPVCPADWLG